MIDVEISDDVYSFEPAFHRHFELRHRLTTGIMPRCCDRYARRVLTLLVIVQSATALSLLRGDDRTVPLHRAGRVRMNSSADLHGRHCCPNRCRTSDAVMVLTLRPNATRKENAIEALGQLGIRPGHALVRSRLAGNGY